MTFMSWAFRWLSHIPNVVWSENHLVWKDVHMPTFHMQILSVLSRLETTPFLIVVTIILYITKHSYIRIHGIHLWNISIRRVGHGSSMISPISCLITLQESSKGITLARIAWLLSMRLSTACPRRPSQPWLRVWLSIYSDYSDGSIFL